MEQPKHIDMQTPNGAELNLDALYKIAPSCFTEAKGDDGEIRHVVDFNKLRLLLGDNAVEDAPEVYDFTWVGKRAALQEQLHLSIRPYARVPKKVRTGTRRKISTSKAITLKC